MKTFPVRLTDEVHEAIKLLAQNRGISIADVVREALEIYSVGVSFAEQGKRLTWEDAGSGEKIEVLIPGFTRKASLMQSLVSRGTRRKISMK